MNILIICHFFPPHKGGVETAAYNTVKELSKLGHNVAVLTSRERINISNLEKFQNFKIFRYKSYYLPEIRHLPQSSNLGLVPKALLNLPKIIRKYKIDIIHLEGRLFPISLFSALMNLIVFKRPMFLTIQGRLRGGFTNYIEYFFDLFVTKLVYTKLNKIICVSESLKIYLNKLGKIRERLIVIPNGVDIHLFKKVDSANFLDKYLDKDKNVKKVIFVGRLDHQKGVQYLIKAIPLILKRYKKVHFFILGNGNLEPQLKQLSKNLNVQSNLEFINMIPLDKMPEFYSSADIFCLPSLHEGFPLSIAEALSIGLIIVASNVEGIPEAITENENGFLFEPRNVEQLSQKLIKALTLNQEQINKITQNNRKLARKEYSWEIITKKIEKLYKDSLYEEYKLK